MKKEITAIISFIIVTIFITYIGTFAEETKKYDFKDFTGVSVGWGMNVKINQSDSYSIEVKTSEENLKYLKVEKSGRKLKFYIDKHNWHKRGDIDITITMPVLTELGLSGGSDGKIKMDVSGKSFSADLSGGSELHGDLKCADINLELSGGSEVSLNGKGDDLKIDGSGGSEFKMKDFSVANVDADLSGGSEVVVKMNGKLNVDASGGSEVTFYGKAEYGHSSLSGGSEIKQGD
jgi:hypothetical protein